MYYNLRNKQIAAASGVDDGYEDRGMAPVGSPRMVAALNRAIDGPHPEAAVSSSGRPNGRNGSGRAPPQQHHGPSGEKYRLSNAAKLQREHASVLNALKRAMSGTHRTLNGKKIGSSRAIFAAMDRDNSGTLDIHEFTGAMKRLGLGLSEVSTQAIPAYCDYQGCF